MAITNVSENDTFDQWRVKTNTISTDLGDAARLTTTATNAVAAINELDANLGDLNNLDVPGADLVAAANEARRVAFALSIALG
jgi:hypothetical protein